MRSSMIVMGVFVAVAVWGLFLGKAAMPFVLLGILLGAFVRLEILPGVAAWVVFNIALALNVALRLSWDSWFWAYLTLALAAFFVGRKLLGDVELDQVYDVKSSGQPVGTRFASGSRTMGSSSSVQPRHMASKPVPGECHPEPNYRAAGMDPKAVAALKAGRSRLAS